MNRQTALKYRKYIEQAAASLSEEDALSAPELYPHWRENLNLKVNERIYWNDKLYRVVQEHTTQLGWEPDITRALFTEITKPGEIPEWRQPTGAQDAYNIGDKVRYNNLVYESIIANNIWSPETYPAGWKLIE